MSRVTLADPQTLPPFLKAMHDNSKPDEWGAKNTARAFASHPDLLKSYLSFYIPMHKNEGVGIVEPRLKELVRLRIATLNGCAACRSARLDPDHVSESEAAVGVDMPERESFSPRERAALRFAERMALDHHSISDDEIRLMRSHFTEAEFLELLMMTGQYIGFGRMAAVLRLEEAICPI
jgi:alkylhydroperoxidase family enzyme